VWFKPWGLLGGLGASGRVSTKHESAQFVHTRNLCCAFDSIALHHDKIRVVLDTCKEACLLEAVSDNLDRYKLSYILLAYS
jgi:hypothetical protein